MAQVAGQIERIDITLGIVELVSGLRFDDPEQEIDPRPVIDAGVEEYVLHDVHAERRTLTSV